MFSRSEFPVGSFSIRYKRPTRNGGETIVVWVPKKGIFGFRQTATKQQNIDH